MTPLHACVNYRDVSITKELLKYGADVNAIFVIGIWCILFIISFIFNFIINFIIKRDSIHLGEKDSTSHSNRIQV